MRSNYYERDEPGAQSAAMDKLQEACSEDAPPEKREHSLLDKAGPPPGVKEKRATWNFLLQAGNAPSQYPVSDKVLTFLDDTVYGVALDGSKCKNGCRFRCRCAQ